MLSYKFSRTKFLLLIRFEPNNYASIILENYRLRIILELLDAEKHNFRIIGCLWNLNIKWMQAAMSD